MHCRAVQQGHLCPGDVRAKSEGCTASAELGDTWEEEVFLSRFLEPAQHGALHPRSQDQEPSCWRSCQRGQATLVGNGESRIGFQRVRSGPSACLRLWDSQGPCLQPNLPQPFQGERPSVTAGTSQGLPPRTRMHTGGQGAAKAHRKSRPQRKKISTLNGSLQVQGWMKQRRCDI